MELLNSELEKLGFNKTALIYDLEVLKHKSTKSHVECPDRITYILDRLKEK